MRCPQTCDAQGGEAAFILFHLAEFQGEVKMMGEAVRAYPDFLSIVK